MDAGVVAGVACEEGLIKVGVTEGVVDRGPLQYRFGVDVVTTGDRIYVSTEWQPLDPSAIPFATFLAPLLPPDAQNPVDITFLVEVREPGVGLGRVLELVWGNTICVIQPSWDIITSTDSQSPSALNLVTDVLGPLVTLEIDAFGGVSDSTALTIASTLEGLPQGVTDIVAGAATTALGAFDLTTLVGLSLIHI